MATSNLMFAFIVGEGPEKIWFVVIILVDGFTAAWGSVSLVASDIDSTCCIDIKA
jgi:hypothetical protein